MGAMIKPEFAQEFVFLTSRTMLSRLWFVPKKAFHDFFISALARYQEIHKVELYAFVLMENHWHGVARFPNNNRAAFMRDLNSMIARALPHFVKEFKGGKLWARPYRFQIIPRDVDVAEWFLYTVLNPVSSGVVENPTSLGRANALTVIREGESRVCPWFHRSKYNNAARKNPTTNPKKYYTYHTLKVSRLPGNESERFELYLNKIEELVRQRKQTLIKNRKDAKRGFLGERTLASRRPGRQPLFTKTSRRYSYNPLVLCGCSRTRKKYIDWYLDIYSVYKAASARFRAGEQEVSFPPCTYLPPRFCSP